MNLMTAASMKSTDFNNMKKFDDDNDGMVTGRNKANLGESVFVNNLTLIRFTLYREAVLLVAYNFLMLANRAGLQQNIIGHAVREYNFIFFFHVNEWCTAVL